MIVNYDDYVLNELLNQLLNESVVNEKINLDKINKVIKKIGDKAGLVYKLIKKFNETENLLTKKHLATVLIMAFFGSVVIKNGGLYPEVSAAGVERAARELAKNYTVDINKIKTLVYPILFPLDSSILKLKPPLIDNVPAIKLNKVRVSHSTKDFIKEHEKLRLDAYDIGDGKITVGYGHASPIETSQYQVGDTITEKEADKLFLEDIKVAEDGVKRMLKSWEEDGIDVRITQSMFDSMVSMAFNMGVYGLMTCNFLDDLKNKNYMEAAEKIKTTRINGKVKNENGEWETVEMPGLPDRRMNEYKLFIKDIT